MARKKKSTSSFLETLAGITILIGGLMAIALWKEQTVSAILWGGGGLGLGLWFLSIDRGFKARRENARIADRMVPQHVRILNDCVRLCQESKNARTRASRASLGLEKILAIEQLRRGTVANRNELVRYLEAVEKCAEVAAAFEKGVSARTAATRSKHLDRARALVHSEGISNEDLRAAQATNPETGDHLTVEAILGTADKTDRPTAVRPERTRSGQKLPPVPTRTAIEYMANDRRVRADARWVAPGEEVEVQGYRLRDGMIYVGRSLPALSEYGGTEPALIDTRLRVDQPRPALSGEDMPYWPSYSEIAPSSRGAYLDWLASGRSDPNANIGYVFLFFYGLERRALTETRNSDDARRELSLIRDEVVRLLGVYGDNRSFASYANGFLGTLSARHPADWRTLRPEGWRAGHELPADLRIAIGQMTQDGARLPADWALAWVTSDPEVNLRTPATRCSDEFEQLFRCKYRNRHGDGLPLRACKRRVTVSYRPASSSFAGMVHVQTDLPDAASLVGPRRKLSDLAMECCDDLGAYSRWIGRNPDKTGTLAAAALLPAELAEEQADSPFRDLRVHLEELVGDRECALVPASPLLDEWLPADGGSLPKKSAVEVARLFARAGFGMEPDIRFTNQRISGVDHVALFRLVRGDAHYESPSPGYTAAGLLLHLATMVSAADGEVARDEKLMLHEHLAGSLALDDAERRRLAAHLERLLAYPPGISGVKKRVAALTLEQRNDAARFLVGVALADGKVEPAEVRMLTKIYRVLGLDPGGVHDAIHSARTAASDDAPVRVREADHSAPGFAIPPPAREPDAAVERTAAPHPLDMSAVQAKLRETAKVSTLLSGIFSEDGPDAGVAPQPEVAPRPATSDGPLSEDLDPEHGMLLERLGDKTQWTQDEYEQLVESLGLMPDGALEVLNELAFDRCGAPLADGDEVIEIDAEVYRELAG